MFWEMTILRKRNRTRYGLLSMAYATMDDQDVEDLYN
jgi:hypothetical protein